MCEGGSYYHKQFFEMKNQVLFGIFAGAVCIFIGAKNVCINVASQMEAEGITVNVEAV